MIDNITKEVELDAKIGLLANLEQSLYNGMTERTSEILAAVSYITVEAELQLYTKEVDDALAAATKLITDRYLEFKTKCAMMSNKIDKILKDNKDVIPQVIVDDIELFDPDLVVDVFETYSVYLGIHTELMQNIMFNKLRVANIISKQKSKPGVKKEGNIYKIH